MKRLVAKRSPANRGIKPTCTAEGLDLAARYFVYKLFDATDGRLQAWHGLRELGERGETVARAVVRGWVVVQHHRKGLTNGSAALTDEGWRLARRSLH